MNLIFTVVAGLPLGYFIARRQTALFAYLVTGSFLFSFQSLGVLLTWMSGGKGMGGSSGFGDDPSGSFPISYSSGEYVAYGVVNLLITLVGIGLVLLGGRVRALHSTRGAVVDVR